MSEGFLDLLGAPPLRFGREKPQPFDGWTNGPPTPGSHCRLRSTARRDEPDTDAQLLSMSARFAVDGRHMVLSERTAPPALKLATKMRCPASAGPPTIVHWHDRNGLIGKFSIAETWAYRHSVIRTRLAESFARLESSRRNSRRQTAAQRKAVGMSASDLWGLVSRNQPPGMQNRALNMAAISRGVRRPSRR